MEPGPDIPDDWRTALGRVAAAGVALILGPTDAGKSTFAGLAARAGAAWLDADPGQGSLGPPACLALARGARRDLAFVGTTDPVRGRPRLVAGAARLARMARGQSLVVNTDGLVAGPGRRLKADLAAALAPDLVVAIGGDEGLAAVLADLAPVPVLRLDPSPLARRKTAGERRAARRAAFARHLAAARPVPLPLAAAGPEGLLLGLLDGRGRTLGLGVATADPGIVLTAVDPARIRRVLPGALLLDADGRDRPLGPTSSA